MLVLETCGETIAIASNCCPCSAPARRACQFLLLQRTWQQWWQAIDCRPAWAWFCSHEVTKSHTFCDKSLLETPRANAEWYLQSVQKTARVKNMWSLCNCCWLPILWKVLTCHTGLEDNHKAIFQRKRLHEGFLTVLRYQIAAKNGCWCDSPGSA